MIKSGEFVVPGQELGTCEEFIPDEGTYEENGKIYASTTGIVEVDLKEKRIKVKPKTSTPPLPKAGDIVIGRIIDVKPQFALVDIIRIKGIDRAVAKNIVGSIHISQTRISYVEDLSKEFRIDDIVCAKITNPNTTPIFLSTKEKNLGVIKAYCGHCNLPLVRVNNKLKCPECGRIELRKISSEYGKGII